MISGFIVKKGSMGKLFLEDGRQIAITHCQALPLTVSQIKTTDTDGYSAIQLAYGQRRRLSKPVATKLEKIKVDKKPLGFIEFKALADSQPQIGQEIAIDAVVKVGDLIDVSGTTKGHGYAGVIKRHGFHRQPVSGGQSDRVRAPGAIGAQTPGKVVRGKKMPGHFGNVVKTVSHLKVVAFDPQKNEILVSGSVPGAINSWVIIKKA